MINKDLAFYMALPYRLEVIPDECEGGYAISCPELKGCISCGDTIEEAVINITEAKKVWIEEALNEGIDIPVPRNEAEYSGQFKLRLPKSLHRSLSEHSKLEGVSMNQYCVYLLSMFDSLEGLKELKAI